MVLSIVLTGLVVLIARTASFPVHRGFVASDVDVNDDHLIVIDRQVAGTDKDVFANMRTASRGSLLKEGVTLDACNKSEECAGDRKCVKSDDPFLEIFYACTNKIENCYCFPDEQQWCKHPADCDDEREVCVAYDEFSRPFCASIVAALDLFTPRPKPGAPERPENTAAGKTLYPCVVDNDCKGNRTCFSAKGRSFIKHRSSCAKEAIFGCLCMPPKVKSCSKNRQCEEGEVCVKLDWTEDKEVLCASADMEKHSRIVSVASDDPQVSPSVSAGESASPEASFGPTLPQASTSPSFDPNQSVVPPVGGVGPDISVTPEMSPLLEPIPSDEPSPEMTLSPPVEPEAESANEPTPSPTEDPICIDARALIHLSQIDLVFDEHTMATVLCDSTGSCATKGHMVVYKGSTMMMRTYCALTECVEKKVEVNSPKYKRGMRVRSNTEGLDFTAFAARYATRVEEAVIKMAVRVGL